jgi:hypothetical protein
MTQETPFQLSDWLGQGKSMASAPPRIHKMAKEIFEIPQSIHYNIIPSPMMSIAKALEFPIPLERTSSDSPQPFQYFSMAAPDIMDKNMTVQRLRRLPIPESKVIRKLAQHSRQA